MGYEKKVSYVNIFVWECMGESLVLTDDRDLVIGVRWGRCRQLFGGATWMEERNSEEKRLKLTFNGRC